ncbi:MAG: hypothetical protein ABIJ22_03315 [Patescibacteria group bacterium]
MLHLTSDRIRQLVSPAFFERGQKYYQQQRIIDYQDNNNQLTATVRGTKNYKVTISLTDLNTTCDCFAFSPHAHCKHVVAVMLAKANGYQSPTHTPTSASPKTQLNHNSSSQQQNNTNSLFQDQGEAEIKFTFQNIKNNINSLKRHHSYWDYIALQEESSDYVMNAISQLPSNQAVLQKLCNLTLWLDKQLLQLDDSDGILQDLIAQVVTWTNSMADFLSDTNYVWPWLQKKAEFDLQLIILSDRLREFSNQEFIHQIVMELEKNYQGQESKITLSTSATAKLLSNYYQQHQVNKFEKFALSGYQQDPYLAQLLIAWYKNHQHPQKIIDLFWSQRDHYQLQDDLEWALIQTSATIKLFQFYEEQAINHFTRETLVKLHQTYLSQHSSTKWQNYVHSLAKKIPNYHQANFYLYLGEYQLATDVILTNTYLDLPRQNEELEQTALKLAILHPPSAIRIYRFLLDQEFAKMKTSNYYPRFLNYAQKLLNLGDQKYLLQVQAATQEKYPTKVTLLKHLEKLLPASK